MTTPDRYQAKNKLRFVTAAALFDGHDAAINIMPRILQAHGAEVIHLATGLVVGYPPCPRIRQFKSFIETKYKIPVVVGTHPIPLKYLKVHKDLSFWGKTKMRDITGDLMDEDPEIMKAYD